MIMIIICEKYGWDYFTYESQPSWFIDLIIERMKIDATKSQQEELKNKG